MTTQNANNDLIVIDTTYSKSNSNHLPNCPICDHHAMRKRGQLTIENPLSAINGVYDNIDYYCEHFIETVSDFSDYDMETLDLIRRAATYAVYVRYNMENAYFYFTDRIAVIDSIIEPDQPNAPKSDAEILRDLMQPSFVSADEAMQNLINASQAPQPAPRFKVNTNARRYKSAELIRMFQDQETLARQTPRQLIPVFGEYYYSDGDSVYVIRQDDDTQTWGFHLMDMDSDFAPDYDSVQDVQAVLNIQFNKKACADVEISVSALVFADKEADKAKALIETIESSDETLAAEMQKLADLKAQQKEIEANIKTRRASLEQAHPTPYKHADDTATRAQIIRNELGSKIAQGKRHGWLTGKASALAIGNYVVSTRAQGFDVQNPVQFWQFLTAHELNEIVSMKLSWGNKETGISRSGANEALNELIQSGINPAGIIETPHSILGITASLDSVDDKPADSETRFSDRT